MVSGPPPGAGLRGGELVLFVGQGAGRHVAMDAAREGAGAPGMRHFLWRHAPRPHAPRALPDSADRSPVRWDALHIIHHLGCITYHPSSEGESRAEAPGGTRRGLSGGGARARRYFAEEAAGAERHDEALRHFARAVDARPDSAEVHSRIAYINHQVPRPTRSRLSSSHPVASLMLTECDFPAPPPVPVLTGQVSSLPSYELDTPRPSPPREFICIQSKTRRTRACALVRARARARRDAAARAAAQARPPDGGGALRTRARGRRRPEQRLAGPAPPPPPRPPSRCLPTLREQQRVQPRR